MRKVGLRKIITVLQPLLKAEMEPTDGEKSIRIRF